MVYLQTMLDWDDYRIFLMVSRTPSIRAAASKLEVSHSTVLRRLDRLEDKLGARLFERRAVGFRLTLAGEDVLQGVHDIEESVQSIDRSVTGRDSALEGIVKVTMPDVFAHPSLFPDLGEFNKRFPNIQLEIDLSYSIADLGKREADIALRVTNDPPQDLIGRKLAPAYIAAYAKKDYVARYRPQELDSQAQRIGFGNPELWQCEHGFGHLNVVGFFDNVMLQLTLARQGVGVASLPFVIGEAEPDLLRISEPIAKSEVWLLYHTDLRNTSRVRAVRDFLQDSVLDQLRALDSSLQAIG
jgi:DNA-binding transcriptional LysR family regulator